MENKFYIVVMNHGDGTKSLMYDYGFHTYNEAKRYLKKGYEIMECPFEYSLE
jgi:hypothetical protein